MKSLSIPTFTNSKMRPTAFPNDIMDNFINFFNIDSFFNSLDSFDPMSNNLSLKGFPRGDIFVENDNLNIEMALAGYSKDQLKVQASPEDNKIIISADKKEESSVNGRSLAKRAFRKTVDVLPEWDLAKAQVTFENGLLKVTIPRSEVVEPRYIDIEIS